MTWTRVGQRLSAKAHGVAGVYASYDEMLTRADVNSIASAGRSTEVSWTLWRSPALLRRFPIT